MAVQSTHAFVVSDRLFLFAISPPLVIEKSYVLTVGHMDDTTLHVKRQAFRLT